MSNILVNLHGCSLFFVFFTIVEVVTVNILFTDKLKEGEVSKALDFLEANIFDIITCLLVVKCAFRIQLLSEVIDPWLRPLISVKARCRESRDSLFKRHGPRLPPIFRSILLKCVLLAVCPDKMRSSIFVVLGQRLRIPCVALPILPFLALIGINDIKIHNWTLFLTFCAVKSVRFSAAA